MEVALYCVLDLRYILHFIFLFLLLYMPTLVVDMQSSTARDAAERSLVDILDMEAAARKRLKG